MKIVTVVGARPQFIKAAIISREIKKNRNTVEIIFHTGQHVDVNMSEVFFKEMEIPKPDYNLGIKSLSHGAMTARQLESIEKIFINEKPDLVLLYGDTNSTLSGALAAAKLNIPIAHVEAGLRSYNKKMPEEINRLLTDHLSELLFAPTITAKKNLLSEGMHKNKIKLVGDVMFDAALHFGKLAELKSDILKKLDLKNQEYILSTVHRQENTDNVQKLKSIFYALSKSPIPVVMPIHPRTKYKINKNNIKYNGIIKIIEPIGYLDMIILEKNALKIVTDSGGIQKEAFFFHTPCITIREETEWIELLDAKVNKLVGHDKNKIINAMKSFSPNNYNYSFYGSGNSGEKILSEIIQFIGNEK